MDIKQLIYFVTVAEKQSFTKAAESLYISQPALSQRINELESELGVTLLERSKRHVTLTEAGKILLASSLDIINRVEGIPNLLERTKNIDSEKQTLNIGVAKEPMKMLWFLQIFGKAISNLKMFYPNVNIEVSEMDYMSVSRLRSNMDFDLFIVLHHEYDALKAEGIHSKTIYTAQLQFLLKKEAGITDKSIKELLNGRDLFLLDNNPGLNFQMSRILADIKVDPQIRYMGSETMSILKVLSGDGAIIFPNCGTINVKGMDDLEHIPIESEAANLYFQAVWHANNTNKMVPFFIHVLEKTIETE